MTMLPMLTRPSGQPWPCSTVARPAFWCEASSLPPSNGWCRVTIRILRPLRFALGKKKRVWKLCSNQRANRVPKGQLRAKDTGCSLSVDLPANFSLRQGEEKDKSWFECGPRKLCPAISACLHLEGGWRLHHRVDGVGCWYECRFAFRYIFSS